MVGVASSNLVSRSIFLFLFLITILSPLRSVEPAPSLDPRLNRVFSELVAQITAQYPALNIDFLELTPTSALPNDFDSYRLNELFLLSLKESDGNFRVLFSRPNGVDRSLFFTFKMEAHATILIATRDIAKGSQLSPTDFIEQKTTLKNYNKSSLSPQIAQKELLRLVARSKIKRGKTLLNSHFAAATDIKKGDQITAHLNDGALFITTSAVAIEAGSIGETISVRLENGQALKATVIAPAVVHIK